MGWHGGRPRPRISNIMRANNNAPFWRGVRNQRRAKKRTSIRRRETTSGRQQYGIFYKYMMSGDLKASAAASSINIESIRTFWRRRQKRGVNDASRGAAQKHHINALRVTAWRAAPVRIGATARRKSRRRKSQTKRLSARCKSLSRSARRDSWRAPVWRRALFARIVRLSKSITS